VNLRPRRLRLVVAALAVLVPARLRRWLLVRLLGHEIHPEARVGPSFVDVDHLIMEEGASIGALNVIRGCELVRLEARSAISALNLINSVRRSPDFFAATPDRRPELILGPSAAITTLHVLDACDRIELAPYAMIAGFGSLVQTHAVDLDAVAQSCRPIRVGDHSMVSSRCTLLPGSVVPDASIVAAGAVVTGELRHPNLFGGVPARAMRPSDPNAEFFTRRNTVIR
jgi:acetyltransferase-like isoleucine patch superfamily enzyme